MSTMHNPWKGLDFYKESEILYGRDIEIDLLYDYICHNTQVILYGRSGIGKSSIINAGIFPKVRLDGRIPISLKLSHDNKVSYIDQIKDVIHQNGVDAYEVIPALREDESLWEFFHRHQFFNNQGVRVNLLLVFDQFEEIFTLQSNENIRLNFFIELANLFNDTAPEYIVEARKEVTPLLPKVNHVQANTSLENEIDIDIDFSQVGRNQKFDKDYLSKSSAHFLFAIREDFLSYLERYTARIPVMRNNRFPLLPLNEEQAAEIIMKPYPGLVSAEVAKLIIAKVAGTIQFELDGVPELEIDAAVLSLYLSRLFEEMMSNSASFFTRELVEQAGSDIIRRFYEEGIAPLPMEKQERLEYLLLTGDNRRDNVSRSDFLAEGFTNNDIHYLVEDVKLLRQFFMRNDLRLEFIHDVLCEVVKESKEKRFLQKQQEEERKRQEKEKQKLQAEAERKQREIEEKAAQEKAELEAETQRIKKRNKRKITIITLTFVGIFLLIGIGWVYSYLYNERVYEEYYAEYELNRGWPQGLGKKLTEAERAITPLYYKLCYTGRKNKGHYTDLTIMSSNKNLPDACRIPVLEWADDENIDSYAESFNTILKNVVHIHFSAAENDSILAQEEYYGKDSVALMTISYFYISSRNTIAQYLTPKGENMKIRLNGMDRVRINWDTLGRITSKTYYDAMEVQQKLIHNKNITGYLWDYSKIDTIVRYALNEFGLPISKGYNTQMQIKRNDSIITIYAHSIRTYQPSPAETNCERGYSKEIKYNDKIYLEDKGKTKHATRTIEKDIHGNVKSIITEGKDCFGYPKYENYKYVDGLLALKEFLSEIDVPFGDDDCTIYKWIYDYDRRGNVCEEMRFNRREECVYHHKIIEQEVQGGVVITDRLEDKRLRLPLVERIDSCLALHKISSYYGNNHTPINHIHILGTDTMFVHKIVIDSVSNKQQIIQEFYVYRQDKIQPNSCRHGMGYYKRIDEFDKDGNLTAFTTYDNNDCIVKSMAYFYQGGKLIGRAAKGIDGGIVRCNKWEEEGLLYYKLLYNKNVENNFSGILTVDEWGNRSSLIMNNTYVFAKPYNFRDCVAKIYDSHSRYLFSTPIYNTYSQLVFEEDNDLSPKEIAYIHVLSHKSKMYNQGKGLKDGDRIVAFESWEDGMPLDALKQEWNNALSHNKEVNITVLRPEGEQLIFHPFKLSINKDEKQYIEYHRIYLSKQELDFFNTYKK